MTPAPPRPDHLLAITVGNTRTRFGLFHGKDLHDPRSMENADPEGIARGVEAALEGTHDAVVAISSVNRRVSEALAGLLRERLGEHVYQFGVDLVIPIENALEDDSTVGQDRLLCALGASVRAEQACVIIDAGTAITVDFVDGEGVFQGGVIAPGLRMMLRALHEQTSALPVVEFRPPEVGRGPFGKFTAEAMVLGVMNAARGLVRETIERFAEAYQAYPQIVATGGDAPALFAESDLVESVVPDLQLIGIAEACARALGDEDHDGTRAWRRPERPDPLGDGE